MLMFWAGLCSVLFWFASVADAAQQLEAKILSLNGDVFVSFQGEPQLPSVAGTVLLEGDSIRTYEKSKATLTLPDGSQVQLGENTNLMVTAIAKDIQKKVSTPRLDLLWGNFRTVLSPIHKNQGSSFMVQTPNTLVNTSASQLDVEIQYDPTAKKTVVLAHEFGARVTNLFSGVSMRIPQGHSGVIYEGIVQEIARIITLAPPTQVRPQTADLTSVQGEVFASIQGAKWVHVQQGTILRSGDAIRTDPKAGAVLKYSDGTTITLQEETSLTIYQLEEDSQTNAWISRAKLFRGEIRTILGEGFRNTASLFTVQTSNARLVVKPAREMDAEIIYDPKTRVTTMMAHKSELTMHHRITEATANIPPGHSVIIHNHAIQQIGRILRPLKK